MAVLDILTFPHPHLRQKAAPVVDFNANLRQLVADMFETMQADNAVGLAATQVDVMQRVFVMDWSDDYTQPYCLINPQIITRQGTQDSEEGCLSVPETRIIVQRAQQVTVQAMSLEGKPVSFTFEDGLAACIQHELDHLDGKLFFDYLSPLKKTMLEKRLRKAQCKV
jgi:peptide deformylase